MKELKRMNTNKIENSGEAQKRKGSFLKTQLWAIKQMLHIQKAE